MSRPLPPGLVKPSDADLEALGIVWVDLAGVTPSGLPYPASSDPVANGAANIQALAQAADDRAPGLLGGPSTSGATVGTSVIGWTPGFTVPAVGFKRLIQVHMHGYTSSLTAGSTIWFSIRLNGTDVRRADSATAKESAFTIYSWALAAGATAAIQGVAQTSAGTASIPADGRFAWMSVYSLGGIV